MDFKKDNIIIFIHETWQKYSGDKGRLLKFTRRLAFRD